MYWMVGRNLLIQKLKQYNKRFVWFICLLLTTSLMAQSKLPTVNHQLQFLKGIDSTWKENPVKNGQYVNHEFPYLHAFKDIWKWKRMTNPYQEIKKKDTTRLPLFDGALAEIQSGKDGVFWLGHATFFIRVKGITFITDPVLGKASGFMKRFSQLPVSLDKLPNIDYILLSHDHRDHCDKNSLKKLKKHSPNAVYLTGLNMNKVIGSFGIRSEIQCAGWYQVYQLDSSRLKISFLPTRHWSKRGPFDTNQHLWGSFMIEIDGMVIYFGGDSGYGSHYKEYSQLFPQIDIAIIGIGAYEPEWFMEQNHSSPAKGFQAFNDLNAKYLIPMHYGTFDLSDEPICYPAEVLEKVASEQQKAQRVLMRPLGYNLMNDMQLKSH